MQGLTAPIDGEWAMARDLSEATGIECVAQYPQAVGGRAIAYAKQVGCAPVSAVSWEHDFSIDVWAGSGTDYAAATEAACSIAGAFQTMHMREPSTGDAWKAPEVTSMYPNPDPDHPGVPRVTVACNAVIRGRGVNS